MRTRDLRLRIAVRYGHLSDRPLAAYVTWSDGHRASLNESAIWDWALDRVIAAAQYGEEDG